jgi:hypothetical protein
MRFGVHAPQFFAREVDRVDELSILAQSMRVAIGKRELSTNTVDQSSLSPHIPREPRMALGFMLRARTRSPVEKRGSAPVAF